jgi:GNAT superfamily N-acetyltransferase
MQVGDDAPMIALEDGTALAQQLVRELTDFNARSTGISDQRDLALEMRDRKDGLQAGLTGWTWGSCAFIDLLWVRADQRRGGLGSRLLAAVEREAAARGCSRILVSSFTFQAPDFYKRNGYQEFARTEGVPLAGHADVHLVKDLSGAEQLRRPT